MSSSNGQLHSSWEVYCSLSGKKISGMNFVASVTEEVALSRAKELHGKRYGKENIYVSPLGVLVLADRIQRQVSQLANATSLAQRCVRVNDEAGARANLTAAREALNAAFRKLK